MNCKQKYKVVSLAVGLLIMFSSLTVMSLITITVVAADPQDWDPGYTVSGTETFQNCNITMLNGYLIIGSGDTLVFNDGVNFTVECDDANDWGIIIESGGIFEINSPSANTIITYGSADEQDTYYFNNSGTVDFSGATINMLYGNKSDLTEPGGIVNNAGSTCILENCKIYDADTHSIFVDDADLNLNGTSSQICEWGATNNDGYGVWIKGDSDVLIEEVSINNTNCYGIKCENADNVTIQSGTIIEDINSDGIYISTSNVTIDDCTIEDCNGYGISVTGTANVEIDSTSVNNTKYGIKCDNADGVIIKDCTINNTDATGLNKQIFLYYSDDCRVTGSTLTTGRITMENSEDCIIENNNFIASGEPLSLETCDRTIIANNTLSACLQSSTCSAMYIYGSDYLEINNNTIDNNNTHKFINGIFLMTCKSATLVNNTLTHNGIQFIVEDQEYLDSHTIGTTNKVNNRPIYYWKNLTSGTIPSGAGQVILANCSNVKVENQNLSDVDMGIYLGHSDNVTLANNTISGNSNNGIIVGYSSSNMIDNNSVSLANYYGIYLSYSSRYNTITNNTLFSNDDDGVRIDDDVGLLSYNNSIFHNSFVSTGSATDNGVGNYWDNGYPYGGNYWSDYTGTDTQSGPSQNLTGSDGIGDSSYSLTGNSDNYPMMAQNMTMYTYFAKTYGGSNIDYAADVRAVQQTSDGGYIVCGGTKSYGGSDYDMWIVKLTSNGAVSWQKYFGGSSDDIALSIQETSDDGYIVAGYTKSYATPTSAGDFWIIKLHENGTKNWSKTYGGSYWDAAYSVQQTNEGGYIVAGYTCSYGGTDKDFWILKLFSNGTRDWGKYYGNNSDEVAYSICQTSEDDGYGYVVTGRTQSFGGADKDAWVIKLNNDGNLTWQNVYGNSSEDWGYSVSVASTGCIVVGGYTKSFGGADKDFWVLKLSAIGTILKQKYYGGGSDDLATTIQETNEGDFIITGGTNSYDGNGEDFWTLKLDDDLDIIWEKAYGGYNTERCYSVYQTSDGGYVMTGFTNSFGQGNWDFWVVKTGPNGAVTFDYGSNAYANTTSCSNANSTTSAIETFSNWGYTNLSDGNPNDNGSATICNIYAQATPSYAWYPDD